MRTFPRVSPGQPLAVPAEEWNAILAASEYTLGHGFRPSLGDLAGQRSAGVCQIDNQCGAARAANDILGISGPAITPTQDEELFSLDVPILAGVAPAAAHYGAFAVLAEPAEAGAIALGIVTGVAAVRVHVTDADHAYAELEAAEYDHLASADSGSAAILWKEAGTGVLWAIVRLGNAGGGAMPPGTADYDMLYWLEADSSWHLLPIASGSAAMPVQKKIDGTLGYDWLRFKTP